MIPDFDQFGNLPSGGHECTWEEFHGRFRFAGRREVLCRALEPIVQLARNCGFLRVMIGGSFPTSKSEPGDIDVTWITDPDVSKDTVRPECVKLMEDHTAKGEFGFNMFFLPIDNDRAQIQKWALLFGFCAKTKKDRGMLVIEL
jgi:hypothetical protein